MISTVLPRANQNYFCSPQVSDSPVRSPLTRFVQLFNSSDPQSQRISSGQFTLIIFSRVFHMLTGFGLSINGKHNYCGDYIYSGHTVSVTISKLSQKVC